MIPKTLKGVKPDYNKIRFRLLVNDPRDDNGRNIAKAKKGNEGYIIMYCDTVAKVKFDFRKTTLWIRTNDIEVIQRTEKEILYTIAVYDKETEECIIEAKELKYEEAARFYKQATVHKGVTIVMLVKGDESKLQKRFLK